MKANFTRGVMFDKPKLFQAFCGVVWYMQLNLDPMYLEASV